jgi:hypothetical protein
MTTAYIDNYTLIITQFIYTRLRRYIKQVSHGEC